MKAVLLCAGRGERMMPLTKTIPKPLLKVNGKCLIDYVYESIPKEIDEVIVVVKYLKDQIIEHMASKNGRRIRFVEGSDKGSAYSFLATRKCLKRERFLLIYGDEMPSAKNVQGCLNEDLSILTYNFGIKDGVMVLNTDIFKCHPDTPDFVSMVESFIHSHKVVFVEAEDFVGQINMPKDLERVNNG